MPLRFVIVGGGPAGSTAATTAARAAVVAAVLPAGPPPRAWARSGHRRPRDGDIDAGGRTRDRPRRRPAAERSARLVRRVGTTRSPLPADTPAHVVRRESTAPSPDRVPPSPPAPTTPVQRCAFRARHQLDGCVADHRGPAGTVPPSDGASTVQPSRAACRPPHRRRRACPNRRPGGTARRPRDIGRGGETVVRLSVAVGSAVEQRGLGPSVGLDAQLGNHRRNDDASRRSPRPWPDPAPP